MISFVMEGKSRKLVDIGIFIKQEIIIVEDLIKDWILA